jgi:hypothetical protein
VSADDGHDSVLGRRVFDTSQEAGGADNVEGGDTEKAAGIEDTGLLEGGSDNGDGGVDGVGDDEDVGFGGDAGDCGSKVADNGGVGLWKKALLNEQVGLINFFLATYVEKVITGHLGMGQFQKCYCNRSSRTHSRLTTKASVKVKCTGASDATNLPWDTSGDNNNFLHTLESLVELISSITCHLHVTQDEPNTYTQPTRPQTSLAVSTWLTSAATPGAPRIS